MATFRTLFPSVQPPALPLDPRESHPEGLEVAGLQQIPQVQNLSDRPFFLLEGRSVKGKWPQSLWRLGLGPRSPSITFLEVPSSRKRTENWELKLSSPYFSWECTKGRGRSLQQLVMAKWEK
jgi:hypothetical protein